MKNKFTIFANGENIYPEIGKFPGGEVRVKLPNILSTEARIEAMLFNSDDIMTLVMLVDALREMGVEKIRLTMPYIPYARQDRVCDEGEAFSIRAFARIINSLNFASVVVWDPHSIVSVALIDRCIVKNQFDILTECKEFKDFKSNNANYWYLVSPDAGSVKKAEDIFNKSNGVFDGIIYAEKVRDLATGKIIKTKVDAQEDKYGNSVITSSNLLIVDDICDGGRTFIELGKVLTPYGPNSLNLFVTHGIFSQGMKVFEPYFDNVWSAINFKDYE